MLRDTYFISTNLEINLDKNKRKILAGNWCIENYEKKENLKRYEIFDNIWKDKQKYNTYYKYLHKISLRYSERLSFYLNSFHKSSFSKKFWKLILMSWLTIYLPAYYYRWILVKKVLKRNKKIHFYDLYNLEKKYIPTDTFDFHTQVSSNKYLNYNMFYNLMKYYEKKSGKIFLVKKKILNSKINKVSDKKNKTNWLIFQYKKILNHFFYFVFRFNKIFIEKAVFPIKNNVEINLRLNQFPTYPNDTFNDSFGYTNLYDNKEINLDKRRSHHIKKIKGENDEFVRFIDFVIRDDIPVCFLEGFEDLLNFARKIIIKPKIILSSYYHYFNELFKVWTAYLVENKNVKFFIVSHGGGGDLKYPSCLKFESEIAHKKINWHKSTKLNEMQLPASKFLKSKNIKSNNDFISYVEGPVAPYPSRIGEQAMDNGSPNLQVDFVSFYKEINKVLKKKFIFIPSGLYNIDTTKYLRGYLNASQIKEKKSFKKYNERSELNILNYPQTAFFESLMTTPTILLYKKDEWEFDKNFNYFYKKFIKHKIIFHDPKKAAKHVNSISNDINKWWGSKSVQLTINGFLDHACLVSSHSLNIWIKYLKKNIRN